MNKDTKKTTGKSGNLKIKIVAIVIAGILLFGSAGTLIGVLLSL